MTASAAPQPLTTSGTPSRAVALLAMRAQGQREGNYDSDRFQTRALRYSLRRVSPLDSVNCGTHNATTKMFKCDSDGAEAMRRAQSAAPRRIAWAKLPRSRLRDNFTSRSPKKPSMRSSVHLRITSGLPVAREGSRRLSAANLPEESFSPAAGRSHFSRMFTFRVSTKLARNSELHCEVGGDRSLGRVASSHLPKQLPRRRHPRWPSPPTSNTLPDARTTCYGLDVAH
jgi:hypothetical protein